MVSRWKNTTEQWGFVSQWMHWLTVLLILANLLMGWVAVRLPVSPQKIDLFVWHKSLGIFTLLFVILRLGWLMFSCPPQAVSGFSDQHWRRAKLVHGVLYLGLILVPLSGWLLNSAANIPLIWFSIWPSIPNWPISSQWQETLAILHVYGFYSFFMLVALHVFFAIWHHTHKSELLGRFLPKGQFSRIFLVIVPILMFAASGAFYWQKSSSSDSLALAGQDRPNNMTVDKSNLEPALHIATDTTLLPLWASIPEESQLTFEGTYEGSPFTGAFKVFTAEVAFDPNKLDQSYLKAEIKTHSVTTFNSDWDSSLPEEDWFATELFPTAYFVAKGFQKVNNRFTTEGELTLKGIKKNVTFSFEWESQSSEKARLIGSAKVNRTDFGIGSGYWAEDDSIGFTVKIAVDTEFQLVMK